MSETFVTPYSHVKNLYDYIDVMKLRTAMYIGENSISAMYHHIGGYNAACELKNSQEVLIPDYEKFNDSIADYYAYTESTAGWKDIILKENNGDEKKSLTEFFRLFDRFRDKVIYESQ